METIFDHNPTPQELENIGFNDVITMLFTGVADRAMTKEIYLQTISPERAIFQIAMLYDERLDLETAARYWAKIPDLYAEYTRGFDYEDIPEPD